MTDFDQRFKGKGSKIDKTGLSGIAQKNGTQVQKDMGNKHNDILGKQGKTAVMLSRWAISSEFT